MTHEVKPNQKPARKRKPSAKSKSNLKLKRRSEFRVVTHHFAKRKKLASTTRARERPTTDVVSRSRGRKIPYDKYHIAKLTGLTPNYIWRVMNRTFPPSLVRAAVLAKVFSFTTGREVSIHELLFALGWSRRRPPLPPYPTINPITIKQSELVDVLCGDKSWVSLLIRGKSRPNVKDALVMATYFKCSVDHLVMAFGWLRGTSIDGGRKRKPGGGRYKYRNKKKGPGDQPPAQAQIATPSPSPSVVPVAPAPASSLV